MFNPPKNAVHLSAHVVVLVNYALEPSDLKQTNKQKNGSSVHMKTSMRKCCSLSFPSHRSFCGFCELYL